MTSNESRKCTATTDAGRPCRQWAIRGTEPALCPAHAGILNGGEPATVNGNGNGHRTMLEERRLYGNEADAPAMLQSLTGEPLPFGELDEILLALLVTEEVTADALAFFDEVVDDGGIFDQMREAAVIRGYYIKRLQNLHGRIGKGHLATFYHLMGREAAPAR